MFEDVVDPRGKADKGKAQMVEKSGKKEKKVGLLETGNVDKMCNTRFLKNMDFQKFSPNGVK